MRIVRFSLRSPRHAEREVRWGALEGGDVVALEGNPLCDGVRRSPERIAIDDVRLHAPTVPSKIVAVGRNYADHVAEMGWSDELPPVVFLKPPSAVVGPHDPIELPPESEHCEAEGELAVIIGETARRIDASNAAHHILGYTIANDVSARDLMANDGQWARAKGFDSFCPLGPWIDTEFEPDTAGIRTRVDGELVQDGDIARMRVPVAALVAQLSHAFKLEPGDVILTGSPAGRRALQPGMAVSISIDGLGTLENPVIAG